MKICSTCKLELSLDNFSKKGNRLQSSCKTCHSKYRKEHYNNRKEYYIQKAKVNRKAFENWFDEYKKNLKCSICGESRWWVLDFHHVDQNTKDENIGNLRRMGSKTKILKEIEKCVVLCSNCHRDLHYKERQAE